MPECIQRLGAQGVTSGSVLGGITGRATKYREKDNSAEVWNQSKPEAIRINTNLQEFPEVSSQALDMPWEEAQAYQVCSLRGRWP